jgi:hypothetical protein
MIIPLVADQRASLQRLSIGAGISASSSQIIALAEAVEQNRNLSLRVLELAPSAHFETEDRLALGSAIASMLLGRHGGSNGLRTLRLNNGIVDQVSLKVL